MRGNTITIELPLKRGKVSKTIPLYQYDYGQKLIITDVELPSYYEVHFSNEMHGDAVTSIGDSTGVEIPDSLLETGENVYLWLYLHESGTDGETEFQGAIPVIKRAKVTDQTPTPHEQSVIEQAINALNGAVETAVEEATAAAIAASQAAQEAAEEAAQDAEAARDAAQAAAGDFQGISADAVQLESDEDPTIAVNHSQGGLYHFSFGIPKGVDGNDGTDGTDGVTFTPSVSSEGVISWTNDGERANPQSVNIKGPKGDTGDPAPSSAVVPAVEAWLEENVAQETGYVLDRSLQASNAAAPADLVGDLKNAIEEIAYKPWTKTEVGLLDQIGSKIAFTTADGGALWDQLITSLRGKLPIEYFDVTWSGADHVTGTMPTQAAENSQFSVTLSPSFGYEITSLSAVMGEDTYTGTAGAGGAYTLTIASVTDDVTVTVATQSATVETIYSAQNLTFDGSSESQIIDTGLEFGSINANAYTENWTMMCKAQSTSTGGYYGVAFQTIEGRILRMNDRPDSKAFVLNQDVYTESPLRQGEVGIVVTHVANADNVLTAYTVQNGEVVKTEVTSQNVAFNISYASNAGELQLGGKTTGSLFIGTISDITIYKAIVDETSISEYLIGGNS